MWFLLKMIQTTEQSKYFHLFLDDAQMKVCFASMDKFNYFF